MFVNKCDLVDDPELIDLVELETRELLPKYGFDGEKVPVDPWQRQRRTGAAGRSGVAAGASSELLDALDAAIPEPMRAIDKPFLMPIEGVHHHRGPRHGGDRQDRAGRDPRSATRSRSSAWATC